MSNQFSVVRSHIVETYLLIHAIMIFFPLFFYGQAKNKLTAPWIKVLKLHKMYTKDTKRQLIHAIMIDQIRDSSGRIQMA